MKPLKLIMSAFGPYAKEQVIDFSKLDGINIFVITGPTGAGKTTIFDAISYALYGESSGSSRGVDSLRSDFAKGDIETFVELDFEFRDQIYKIRRYPTQQINKKRGDGLKEEKARAELYLPNGKVITKVKDATDKIYEILGIDKEQFKQIVMIPQGEFKKLLLADSKERGVIFRKIFGTYDFEKIQNALKDKADNMRRNVQYYTDEITVNVKGIKSKDNYEIPLNLNTKQYLDIIQSFLKEDKDIYDNKNKELNKLKIDENKLKEELIKSQQINELINESNLVRNQLVELTNQKEEIDKNRLILNRGKKAKLIEPVELLYIQKIRDKDTKDKSLVSLKNDLLKSDEALRNAKNKLKNELKNEPIKDILNKDIISLNEKLEKLKGVDGKEEIIKSLESKLNFINESIISKEKMLVDQNKDREELENEIKNLMSLEKSLLEKENEKNVVKEKREKLLNLYKEIQTYEKELDIYENSIKKREKIDNDYNDALNKYETYDSRFKLGQAGILANELKDGKECPVCGATHHPKKAELLESTPTEDDIKKAKSELDNIRKERENFYSGLKVQYNVVSTKKLDIEEKSIVELNNKFGYEFVFTEELKELIVNIGTKVKFDLEKFDKEINIVKVSLSKKDQLEKKLQDIKEVIKKVDQQLSSEREYKINIISDMAKEKEILNSVLKEIPEDYRDKEKLSEHVKLKLEEFKIIDKKIEDAKKLEIDESKLNESINAKLKSVEEDISNIQFDIVELEKQFKDLLNQNEFKSIEEYNSCKLEQHILNSLEIKINDYDNNFKVLYLKNNDLEQKCKGLVLIDTQILKDKINMYFNLINDTEKELNIIFARYDNNKHRFKQIENIYEKIKLLEEKYSVVGQLSNYANGKISPYISFESYVLAVYFKQIIDAANIRLSKMTSGRFILKRKEDKGKGAGQKGLDLEVFDNYTGKLRDVSTLSGGESFKASLSLALGLSDIIQMHAGGIKLDTMFIDEGFGTLDQESLDNAVGCLLELQQGGRLVGIISHVPELKERIERKLIITPTREGSIANFSD